MNISLTRGQVAVVDPIDYFRLIRFRWHAVKYKNGFYAARTEGKKTVLMHREILELTDPKSQGEHYDGDGLNNRRRNLRIATKRQNGQAFRTPNEDKTSQYRGVSWHNKDNRWRVQICIDKKRIFLGNFTNEVSAAQAYDREASRCFGDFLQLNFPPPHHPQHKEN